MCQKGTRSRVHVFIGVQTKVRFSREKTRSGPGPVGGSLLHAKVKVL